MQAAISVPAAAKTGIDVRPIRRYLAAVVLVVAPLLVAVLRTIIPYPATQDTAQLIASVTLRPGAQQAVVVLGPFCALAMIFASLSLARLVSPRAPVLAAIGGALSLAGWAMLPVLTAFDALLGEIARSHLVGGAALYDAFGNNSTLGAMVGVFILGHIVGTLLLGVAMLRAGLTPAWAGIAVIVGTILHPVALLVLANHPLDGADYVTVAVGFTAAALAIVWSENAHWDISPEARA